MSPLFDGVHKSNNAACSELVACFMMSHFFPSSVVIHSYITIFVIDWKNV